MRTYQLVLLFHIVGGAGLVLGACCELAGLLLLRRARSIAEVRRAVAVAGMALVIDPVSSLLVLGTGLYMTATAWTWTTPWIVVALAAFALITILAPNLHGRRLLAIRRMVRDGEDGPLPDTLRSLIHAPLLGASIQAVLPLTLSFLLLMWLKPTVTGSLAILGAALVVGVISSLPTWLPGKAAGEERSG